MGRRCAAGGGIGAPGESGRRQTCAVGGRRARSVGRRARSAGRRAQSAGRRARLAGRRVRSAGRQREDGASLEPCTHGPLERCTYPSGVQSDHCG